MPRLPNINVRHKAPTIGLIALYLYLAFHAFSGSQGLLSWMTYSDEAKHLAVELESKQEQHLALKSRVDALRNEGLDLDVLDIETRRSLFVSDTKEMTIWLDP